MHYTNRDDFETFLTDDTRTGTVTMSMYATSASVVFASPFATGPVIVTGVFARGTGMGGVDKANVRPVISNVTTSGFTLENTAVEPDLWGGENIATITFHYHAFKALTT